MELTIDEALQRGVQAHKDGKLQQAESLYRAILQADPNHADANHNLGVLAVAVDKISVAITLFEKALNSNPGVDQFWLSYISALIKEDRHVEAEQALADGKRAGVSQEKLAPLHDQVGPTKKDKNEAFPFFQRRKKLSKKKNSKKSKKGSPKKALSLLLAHYQARRFEEAEELATNITQNFPEHPLGWKVLGAVLNERSKPVESVNAHEKAILVSPQDPEVHNNLGCSLQNLGRFDEAEVAFKQALLLKPDFAQAHYNLGNLYVKTRRLTEAEVSYKEAIALKPTYPIAYYNLGNTLQELHRAEEAVVAYRAAISMQPSYTDAHFNLGNSLRYLNQFSKAEKAYRQAITLQPDYAEAHNNLGVTLKALGRLDESGHSFALAIDFNPEFAEAHRNLASVKQFSSYDEQYSRMRALYQDPELSDEKRCHINFGLAKAHEDLKDYERAFRHYKEGNAIRKKTLNYDIAQDIELFSQIRKTFTTLQKSQISADELEKQITPIFIIGMPRSGTTLVEQIISSHSKVTGAGELPFIGQLGSAIAKGTSQLSLEALLNFRQSYLVNLQSRSENNQFVTDKMPHNFLFLGLIGITFPEAKIVHVKRDPAAVCWANYTKHFSSTNIGYCYSLEDIIQYHGLYERLMSLWTSYFGKSIYELDYEALTVQQEYETRQVIDYLDLAWEDACLSPQNNWRSVTTASNMQIRQGVYQGSSEQWKRYAPFLEGKLDNFQSQRK